MSEPYAYAFEPEDFNRLEGVCKALYGDGSPMTEDRRRDLANLLRTTLERAVRLSKTDVNL